MDAKPLVFQRQEPHESPPAPLPKLRPCICHCLVVGRLKKITAKRYTLYMYKGDKSNPKIKCLHFLEKNKYLNLPRKPVIFISGFIGGLCNFQMYKEG